MPERHFILIVQESRYPQMGALYLTNALLLFGIVTHIIGSSASTEELDGLIARHDPIAVGCSVMTGPEIVDFVRHSLHIQRTYNLPLTTIPVIWGGMHPTIVEEQTRKEWYIDFVVSGEAEITLPAMLSEVINTNTWPDQKLVAVRTPAHLDALRPHWEEIDITRHIFPESHSVHAHGDLELKRQNIFYYFLTSRGCTYKCNFCWEVARTQALRNEMKRDGVQDDLTWRSHSVQWIKTQLDYLETRLGQDGITLDGIGFWDDMPFGRGTIEHTGRFREIAEMMRERHFGYLLEARANQLIATTDKWSGIYREADLYKLLKETGCMQVFVGTESASQETLNLIQKGTKREDYDRLVELSRDVGLPLRFSMIVGFPKEKEESVNQTLHFIEELEGEPYISVSGPKLFTPYPGTPQYTMAVEAEMVVPTTTIGWAHLTRYADYRAIYPWLEDYSQATLNRIDRFWEDVPEEKKTKPKEEIILDIVRGH